MFLPIAADVRARERSFSRRRAASLARFGSRVMSLLVLGEETRVVASPYSG